MDTSNTSGSETAGRKRGSRAKTTETAAHLQAETRVANQLTQNRQSASSSPVPSQPASPSTDSAPTTGANAANNSVIASSTNPSNLLNGQYAEYPPHRHPRNEPTKYYTLAHPGRQAPSSPTKTDSQSQHPSHIQVLRHANTSLNLSTPTSSPTTAAPLDVSVESMIPDSSISHETAKSLQEKIIQGPLILAAQDSPHFRAHAQAFDEELEDIAKWIDGLSKGLKAYADEVARVNEVTTTLLVKLTGPTKCSMLVEKSVQALRTFSDTLQTVQSLKTKLVDDVVDHVVNPLRQYLKEDIRDIREEKRAFDKTGERYDAAIVKYSALSKSKEASALREDAFQLYEVRKNYVKSSLEHTGRMIALKTNLNNLVVERVMQVLSAHTEFYETSNMVFQGLKPQVDALKSKLSVTREIQLKNWSKMNAMKKDLEEEVYTKWRPPRASITSTTDKPRSSVLAPVKASMNVQTLKSPPTKEGYLFKRFTPKNALVQSYWSRRYFIIKNGQFTYYFTNLNGKYHGTVLVAKPINVLLCEIKIDRTLDRRFCFEVVSSRKNYILQAESEDELQDWISAFETAKQFAVRGDPGTNAEDPLLIGSHQMDVDEDEDGEPLSVIAPNPCMSIIPGIVISSEAQLTKYLNATSNIDMSGLDMGGDLLANTVDQNGKTDTDIAGESGKSGRENESPAADLDASESLPKNFQDLPTGKGEHKATVSTQLQTLKYPDVALERKNEELHSLLKSVPGNDWVLDVFTCALQKDILLHGRIFLTQNRICFHSNILGYITVLVLHFREITSITRKARPFNSSIIVTTLTSQYIFKTFFKDDMRTFGVLKAVWNNSCESQPLPVQALFDSIYNSYLKAESGREKEDESITARKQLTAEGTGLVGSDDKHRTGASAASQAYRLPPDVSVPNDIKCGCSEHLEKQEIDLVLNIPAKRAYEILSGECSNYWDRYHAKSNHKNAKYQEWSKNGDETVRSGTAIVPVNNPMVKVKETEIQIQQVRMQKQEYFAYLFELRNQTPQLPYGDAFQVISRICITWKSESTCRLHINVGVKFFKNVMMKSVIRSAALKGLTETNAFIKSLLEDEARSFNSEATGEQPKVESLLAGSADASSGAHVTSSSATKESDSGIFQILKSVFGTLYVWVALISVLAVSWVYFSNPLNHDFTYQYASDSEAWIDLIEKGYQDWNSVLHTDTELFGKSSNTLSWIFASFSLANLKSLAKKLYFWDVSSFTLEELSIGRCDQDQTTSECLNRYSGKLRGKREWDYLMEKFLESHFVHQYLEPSSQLQRDKNSALKTRNTSQLLLLPPILHISSAHVDSFCPTHSAKSGNGDRTVIPSYEAGKRHPMYPKSKHLYTSETIQKLYHSVNHHAIYAKLLDMHHSILSLRHQTAQVLRRLKSFEVDIVKSIFINWVTDKIGYCRTLTSDFAAIVDEERKRISSKQNGKDPISASTSKAKDRLRQEIVKDCLDFNEVMEKLKLNGFTTN